MTPKISDENKISHQTFINLFILIGGVRERPFNLKGGGGGGGGGGYGFFLKKYSDSQCC